LRSLRQQLVHRVCLQAILSKFLVAGALVALVGCQTTPSKDITPASRDGAWSAKTLVQDKLKHKSNQIDLEIVAQRPQRLRMEATTPGLGIHVASFAMNGDHMSYILTRQKLHVSGPATEQAVQQLMKVAIAPQSLVDLFFDRPLNEANWKCSTDSKNQLAHCEHNSGKLSVNWSERESNRRIVEIDSESAKVTMSLTESPSKVQVDDSLFELPVPDGFRAQTLR
jgi:hypothetical protein